MYFRCISKAPLTELGKDLASAMADTLLGRIASENERPVGVITEIEIAEGGYNAVITRLPRNLPRSFSCLPPDGMTDISIFKRVEWI